MGNETLCTIDGHWDKQIKIKEKRTGNQSVLWEVNQTTFNRRLKRYVVPLDKQHEFESANLWKKVSEAIIVGDQKAATVEKTKLEDRQRKEARFRLENNVEYEPKLFKLDPLTNEWHYKYEDLRPWDHRTDIVQFEKSFAIQTLTKHRTISKTSLTNLNASIGNCSVAELTPALSRTGYKNLTNLTPHMANVRKRSPKSRSKHLQHHNELLLGHLSSNSDSLHRKSDKNDNLFDKFDSIDGDEEEDTDYSGHKSTSKSSLLASKLIKRIEQNESEFKNSLISLKTRQQKLEQIVLEERQKASNRLPAIRSLFNSTNLITIFILTIAIQLIIYKFNNNNNNNYLRK